MADLASAWAMARRETKYRRKVDAATPPYLTWRLDLIRAEDVLIEF